MQAIFIRYRRNDSEGEAGRLFVELYEMVSGRHAFPDTSLLNLGSAILERDPERRENDEVQGCSRR